MFGERNEIKKINEVWIPKEMLETSKLRGLNIEDLEDIE